MTYQAQKGLDFGVCQRQGWIQPQLLDSLCCAEHPPWIHDGLNSWSHCGRIHIYTAWVSGYALRSVWTQHTSIANILPWFWRRQSHHPSRLNNMLGSICLDSSALTSGRSQGLCTTQRAFVHIWKILGFPPWRQYTALMLHPWWSAKNLLSGPGKKDIQLPWDFQGPLVWRAVDKNHFWSLHSICRGLCKSADLHPSF